MVGPVTWGSMKIENRGMEKWKYKDGEGECRMGKTIVGNPPHLSQHYISPLLALYLAAPANIILSITIQLINTIVLAERSGSPSYL